MTTNVQTLDAAIDDYQRAIDTQAAEIAALTLENNALKATNAAYENTMRYIHRDVPYPARARLDRLFGKCEL